MFESWVKHLGAAGVVGIMLVGAAADGRTVNLVDNAGASIGWQATIPEGGQADSIQLSYVRTGPGGTVFFDKTATITDNDVPLVIEFTRTSASAPALAIGTEAITNDSGAAWIGYRTFVSTATAAGGTGAGFQLVVSASGPFDINPFTTMSFVNNNTEMVVGGGVVANGDVWTPGSPTTGGIIIFSANAADDRFLLKELPIIPLPAAAWTGMSTLLGLGMLGAIKRVRRS